MMKMKKTAVLLFIALWSAVSLTACGDAAGSSSAASAESAQTALSSSETETLGEAPSSSAAEQSSEPASDNKAAEHAVPEDNSKQTTSAATGGAGTEKLSSVEEYLALPTVQESIDVLSQTLEASGLKMTVTGEGSRLIYTYTYGTQVDAAAAKPLLESGLDNQAATMETVAASLKLYVDIEDPIVVVRYLNADGSEIYTREFQAE